MPRLFIEYPPHKWRNVYVLDGRVEMASRPLSRAALPSLCQSASFCIQDSLEVAGGGVRRQGHMER